MLDELQIHATYNVGKFWLAKRIIFLHLVVCTFFCHEKKNNNCSCSCNTNVLFIWSDQEIPTYKILFYYSCVYFFTMFKKTMCTLIPPKVVLKNYKCKIKPLMFWCQKIKLSWHHQIRIDFSKALQQLSYLVYMAEFNCFLNGSIMT